MFVGLFTNLFVVNFCLFAFVWLFTSLFVCLLCSASHLEHTDEKRAPHVVWLHAPTQEEREEKGRATGFKEKGDRNGSIVEQHTQCRPHCLLPATSVDIQCCL